MKKNDLKKVAQYYDKRAKNSDQIQAAGQWGGKEFMPLICEEICKKINIKKSDRVLELGCGSGVLGNWVQDRCDYYAGLDISFFMLKKFQLVIKQDESLDLIQALTDSVPFLDNVFDIVLINGVTMYFHEDSLLDRTLSEIKRVATKNATIFIGENVVPSRKYWEYTWFQNLNLFQQIFAKLYIKMRTWHAKKYPKYAGKWKDFHREVDPNFIKRFFGEKSKVIISDAAAMTIKQKSLGKNWKGNRRMDFVINL